jgi:hypothetical protein
MAPLGPADVVDKAAELLAQGDEDLVLVLDRLCSGGRDGLATDDSEPARDTERGRQGGGEQAGQRERQRGG